MTGAALAFAGVGLSVLAGVWAAWWLHRRTHLSPRNAYLAWIASAGLASGAVMTRQPLAIVAGGCVVVGCTVAAVLGRRWRLVALGAGGELRDFERTRVMVWTALRHRHASSGERIWIGGQGELVRERSWPQAVRALPMTGDGRACVPLQEGHHQLFVGATGSGKTTSARRVLLARGLTEQRISVLALDPKGDSGLEDDLRGIAAARHRPFVIFDPYDAQTDRWNPIWADDPGAVVARLVAPVEADSDSDASHYSRVLRVHLGLVCEALEAAGQWPIALPGLLRLAQRPRFTQLVEWAKNVHASVELRERLADHQLALGERVTQGQLDGSVRALEVVAGQAWRRVLTPSDRGAVTLPAAMASGAVVLWKTHVEDIKEEAETITTLALADIGAAARTLPASCQWVLLLDEFGSVLEGRAGARAVALMQRARSSNGQVLVSTQSVSDVPSATGNEHLLGALTDNFSAFVVHRQTSPESRDWLAKLLGTREIWQSTDRTIAGRVDGAGSRRRAAEFIVRPDEFRQLKPGEAVIASTLGLPPERVLVTPGPSLDASEPVSTDPLYRPIPLAPTFESPTEGPPDPVDGLDTVSENDGSSAPGDASESGASRGIAAPTSTTGKGLPWE